MAWGSTRVDLGFEVPPSLPYIVSPEEAEPYLGEWDLRWTWGPEDARGPHPFTIRHAEDGSLRGRTVLPGESGPEEAVMLLQPRAEGIFRPGMMEDGELRQTLEAYFEFEFEDGVPVAFALRGGREDSVWMEGRRAGR